MVSEKVIMTSTAKLLRELIAIPSVNPSFLPPNDPRVGEQRVADYLAAVAASAGLDVEFREVLPGRSNLLARLLPINKVKQRIMLAPHMDTVGEPGTHASMFEPRVHNGRLFGRGACDTKGCVAAMLTALMSLARSAGRPKETEIVFVGLIDEEDGQRGSRALADSGFKADLAIVGEPTRLQVVTAHKGDVWLRMETIGKAAHGARPELGRNAVHSMARVVELLETTYAKQLRRRRHPLLRHATVNVGTIAGGTQPNIVPARCAISVDRRTLPGETDRSVFREIRALLRQHHLDARMVSTRNGVCLPLETDRDLPLVRQFMNCVRQTKPVGVDFFCDAAVLAGGGTPSVVFGPGDIAQAHTAEEWISLRSLEDGCQILKRFLQSLP
jgi:succinyl-diaminopimelate desuccinylase